jgi:hypothetical protein
MDYQAAVKIARFIASAFDTDNIENKHVTFAKLAVTTSVLAAIFTARYLQSPAAHSNPRGAA